MDNFYRWIVNRLPRRLVYFAGMKLLVYATQGKFSHVEVPSVLIVDALDRWDKQCA